VARGASAKLSPGHRAHAAQPRSWRLAQLEAHRQRVGVQPLDQINTRNVERLQLAWSWAMENTGAQETTPLVLRRVMYLPNPRGVIQALDAATEDLLWEYRPERDEVSHGSWPDGTGR